MMEEDLWVMAAAVASEYITMSELAAWAEQEVLRMDSPPTWLLDLCMARTKEVALGLLWPAWDRRMELLGTTRLGYEKYGDAYMGFLYLSFDRGNLSMSELLNLAGLYSDCSGYTIECEAFYVLLNEIDGGGPTIPSGLPLDQRVSELFAPMVSVALRYIHLLPMVEHPA